jgi:hypothetical protein
VISGILREVHGNCVLLGHYAASSGNYLPTFRDDLSVPSSRVKNLLGLSEKVFEISVSTKETLQCQNPQHLVLNHDRIVYVSRLQMKIVKQ